jgi:hypothetical protein
VDFSFVGEFFRTLPAVFTALWAFIDGWRGIAVMIGSGVLIVVFAFAAMRLRDSSGWLSSIFGMMSATVLLWWLFGIIPSAWVYFADAESDLMTGTIIPAALPGMGNFYQLFRDLVVAGEMGVAIIAFVVAAFWLQKRYPRSLAEGEESRPQSGGYK